ncbi:hypothetical protein FRC08_011420 [Ceratobasidium sp. 394]|nr:hypothetical protein FRC08_011420 [Ceratobasidium sp. 394]
MHHSRQASGTRRRQKYIDGQRQRVGSLQTKRGVKFGGKLSAPQFRRTHRLSHSDGALDRGARMPVRSRWGRGWKRSRIRPEKRARPTKARQEWHGARPSLHVIVVHTKRRGYIELESRIPTTQN